MVTILMSHLISIFLLIPNSHSLNLHLHPHKTFNFSVVSGASIGTGQYLVTLYLGTPPQKLMLVADTGSDLTWVKCSACRNCSAHFPRPVFAPRHSPTFSNAKCRDPACNLVPHATPHRCTNRSSCRYRYSYADGSETRGFLSKENLRLNATLLKPADPARSVMFGCAFKVSGPSLTGPSFNGADGVMGLGRGPISLPSQLGRSPRFGSNRFSYCLLDFILSPTPTSYLVIGGDSTPHSGKMRFMPLLANAFSPTFYYVDVVRVYVDGKKLRIDPSVWALDRFGNGGMVIDSGTTLSFFPGPAYERVLIAFRRRIIYPMVDGKPLGFDLCVNVSGVGKPVFPKLDFLMGGKTAFKPPSENYFIAASENIKCMAIQAVNSPLGFGVIGNLMQQGFLLEFDSDGSRLGFTRKGCAFP